MIQSMLRKIVATRYVWKVPTEINDPHRGRVVLLDKADVVVVVSTKDPTYAKVLSQYGLLYVEYGFLESVE